jgi:hypothetical protein
MTAEDPLEKDPTLANRFLVQRVSEEERASLEAAMTADVTIARDLEAAARFKVGLQKLRERGELDALLEQQPPQSRWWLAAAAALILGMGVFVGRWVLTPALVVSAALDRLDGNAARTLPVLGPYAAFQPRGAETQVALPAARQAVHLRVYAGLAQGPFRVSFVRLNQSGSEDSLGSILVERDASDGFVSFYADSQELTAGRYKVVMSSSAEPKRDPEVFVFEFQPPSSNPELD